MFAMTILVRISEAVSILFAIRGGQVPSRPGFISGNNYALGSIRSSY